MSGKKILRTILLVSIFTLLCVQGVMAAPDSKENYKKVAEDKRLELWIDDLCTQIEIVDKETGMVWESSISEDTFDISTLNANFQKKIKSLFVINYTDLEKGYGAVMSSSLAELEYETTLEEIDNGVKVYYDLKAPEIKLAIEFKLEDENLVVTIPDKDFEEYGKYAATSIRLLPYFLGAPDNIDGYYFFPDGSGAIMEFKDSVHFGESEMSLNVYGNLKNYEGMLEKWSQADPIVMLPVFGASIEKDGVLAVITDGAEASQIKLSPTNSVVPVNSLNCEFIYRRSFHDQRVTDQSVSIFDRDYIKEDRSVTFVFLDENKNSYSDMAVKYREYLMEKEGVTKKEEEDVKVSVDLFMGIKERGMLFDVFKPVTTFSQAKSILESLKESGVSAIDVQLKGWMKNGYGSQPVQFPPSSKLGGTKGLNKLAKYAADNNINLSLIVDFIEAKSKYGGFSKRNDVVYLGNKAILTDYSESTFLLSPFAVKENFNSFMKKVEKYDLSGIQLANLGNNVLYNYNSSHYQTASDAIDTYAEMVTKLNETFEKSSVEGGNAYVIPYVDKVTDIPISDTGFQLTTKAVPFYQIALHGIVNYTGTAGNLTSDLEKEKLKWIELGYMPHYELTYEGSEDLMYTSYNQLFTSGYYEWGESLSDIYKEFSDNLQGVWNETIESHEEVKDDVIKVTYSNGTSVYVNYNEKDVVVDDVKIGAMGYVVEGVR